MCRQEAAALAFAIQDFECDAVLEIGVHAGGSLLLWRRLFDPTVLVGVDNDAGALRTGPLCDAKIFAPMVSQDIGTVEAVETFLDGRRLDMLVVDGGHKMCEVAVDFSEYSGFVRVGGWVVFHDIHAPVTDECQVPVFWERAKTWYPWREFHVPDAPGSTGIGLLFL